MKDIELSPVEVLSWPHDVDLLNTRGWRVQWDETSTALVRELVEHRMPPAVGFHTSGTTGDPQPWELRPQQMLAEVTALTRLFTGGFDGVVAFAPPRHRYGALCTLLLPAMLGCPVWARPRSVGPLPSLTGGRWLIVAIPHTFSILRQRLDWLAAARSVTVLHSSARLPETAQGLLTELPQLDLSIVELLGSTESGAVATRSHPPGGELWTLVPGVDFASAGAGSGAEERLTVRNPWLARTPGASSAPPMHELRDVIERRGNRGLRLLGRVGRIVKINGERHDLDDIAARFAVHLGSRDVACVAVLDPLVGEHFELYIVDPGRHRDALDTQIRWAIDAVGLHPRRVRLVPALPASGTEKDLSRQPTAREEANRGNPNHAVGRRPQSH